MSLAWVVVVGVIGIVLYAEMAGAWRLSRNAPSLTSFENVSARGLRW
jgi:hypothetical protein